MAHYAIPGLRTEIDGHAARPIVDVIVVDDARLIDDNGIESEAVGAAFLAELGISESIQTSYNGRIRGMFAPIGGFHLTELDLFVSPRPYPSWSLDEAGEWQPPVQPPEDGQEYNWDEDTQIWIATTPTAE